MKTITALALTSLLAACGAADGPLGICYALKTKVDGELVEPTLWWAECLPDSDVGQCHTQIKFIGLDDVRADDDAVPCGECLSDDGCASVTGSGNRGIGGLDV